MTLNCIRWWGSIYGDLGSVDYLFIAPWHLISNWPCVTFWSRGESNKFTFVSLGQCRVERKPATWATTGHLYNFPLDLVLRLSELFFRAFWFKVHFPWHTIEINLKKIKNKNKFRKCSSSQKTPPQTGSQNSACLKKSYFRALKRNSLTSALPLILDGPSFLRLLPGSARALQTWSRTEGRIVCVSSGSDLYWVHWLNASQTSKTYWNDSLYILTSCLGDATISTGFRKNSPPIE